MTDWDDEWDRDAVPGQWYCELCDCYHEGAEDCPAEDEPAAVVTVHPSERFL